MRAAGGCRIIEREYVNSADFKNWAIPQARHEWVLVVDFDARVTPARAGLIVCGLAAYYTFLKDIKHWAREHDRSANAEQIHTPAAKTTLSRAA